MKNKTKNRIIILLLGFSIVFNGYLFIENKNKGKNSKINSLAELSYNTVLLIGIFYLVNSLAK